MFGGEFKPPRINIQYNDKRIRRIVKKYEFIVRTILRKVEITTK
jgi:hypothetical protein